MEVRNVVYVGPTGVNPELGYCECNKEKDIPVHLYEKYKEMGYIQEPAPTKKLKRSAKEEA